MEKFIIEKGIEIPETRGRNIIYPFGQMEVGDSFLISDIYSRELMSKYANAARNWKNKKENGWNFSIRKVVNGIRIWRIK